MLNIDVSRIIPPKAFDHLAAFRPGLSFVLTIAVANPSTITHLAAKTGNFYNLGPYTTIGAALFLAFVIGNGFLLVDTIIQWILSYLYQFKIFAIRMLCRWPIRQLTQWAIMKPALQKPWLGRFHQRAWTISQLGFDDWWKYYDCWRAFAIALLEQRYQIKLEQFTNESFPVLWTTLGKMTPEEFRGNLPLIAIHATGWAGLAATLFAPCLRNKFYVLFCLFFVFNGLLHAYYVIKRRFDPRIAGLITVRAVMREFPRIAKPPFHEHYDE